ncbi:MAG: S8 family serine peptidase [Candidatus Kapaibacteriota bacterium]
MNKFLKLFFLALSSTFLFFACEKYDISNITKEEATTTEHYIVLLKTSKDLTTLSSSSAENYVKSFILANNISSGQVTYIYKKAVVGFAGYLTKEQVGRLSKSTEVKVVEKDQLMFLPPFEINEEDPKTETPLAQTTPWGITAVGGYVNSSNLSRIAWIVDTGIDLDHPDLNVNTSLSRTFVRSGRDSRNADDNNGHGTHVAGIIAAKNNSIGVVGVAAGATVVAVKVLSSNGSGYVSDIVAGLDFVANYGRANDVVNLSLGGSASTTLDNAVTGCANAGLIVVIAAGNSSANAGNYSPARVNGTNIYTISAHNNSDVFASFSNYGNPPIDYCAPGVSIYSTYKGGRYATMSGTSMAAPHVAGILLVNNGSIYTRGYVSNDPDNNADPLASRTQ